MCNLEQRGIDQFVVVIGQLRSAGEQGLNFWTRLATPIQKVRDTLFLFPL
jgi:hypothetical protein